MSQRLNAFPARRKWVHQRSRKKEDARLTLARWASSVGSGVYAGAQTVKALWSSVQGDPAFMQRVNGWLTIFWIAMIPISIATGWINSVAYVASLSLWALVSGHWSAWQAARVEVAEKKEEERKVAEDTAGEIVERVVEETTVEKQG